MRVQRSGFGLISRPDGTNIKFHGSESSVEQKKKLLLNWGKDLCHFNIMIHFITSNLSQELPSGGEVRFVVLNISKVHWRNVSKENNKQWHHLHKDNVNPVEICCENHTLQQPLEGSRSVWTSSNQTGGVDQPMGIKDVCEMMSSVRIHVSVNHDWLIDWLTGGFSWCVCSHRASKRFPVHVKSSVTPVSHWLVVPLALQCSV